MSRQFLSILSAGLLAACSSEQRLADPGNGSETTNGFTAVILDTDGRPAPFARVFLRSPDYVSDTGNLRLAPEPDYVADSEGVLRIDSLREDRVFLEAFHGRKESVLRTIDRAAFDGRTDTIRLAQVGAIYGIVDRSNIPGSARIFVQIRGLERISEVDSTGSFSFASLPPGNHPIRIVSDQARLGIGEGDTVPASPGQQQNGGTFRLPFEYWRDTAVVRAILDGSGLETLPVDSVVARVSDGRVVGLNLENRGIERIPADISSLRLRNLSLGGNRLDSLPDAIGRIFSLHVLSVKNNRLVFVPGSIGDLPELRTLDLSSNELGSLPENIVRLKGLSTLSVRDNLLRDVRAPVGTWLDTYCTDTIGGDWRSKQR